jgi:poly(3-hydroxybutyrate) depolymerase
MKTKNTLVASLVALLLITLTPFVQAEGSMGDRTFLLNVDNGYFIAHVPAGHALGDKLAVVILSHKGNKLEAIKQLADYSLTNNDGAIVMYPIALKEASDYGLRIAPADKRVDGKQFASAMLAVVNEKFNIDNDKVYAAKMGNDGKLMVAKFSIQSTNRMIAMAR